VTEFNYRYAGPDNACVFAGVELTGGDAERRELIDALTARHFSVLDMTHNETAKLHVRHMIGGHASLSGERIYRFRFPERPGALYDFLSRVGERWNISLFHYRNHGAAYGRVLVGLQAMDSDDKSLQRFVADLDFIAEDESDNDAIGLFLR